MNASARLHPDDLAALAQLIAAELAERVLAELGASISDDVASARSRLLTAAEVGQLVGLTRDSVYARADEFGAVRIGTGPKARLRFDAEKVAAALSACSTGRRSGEPNPSLPRRSGRLRAPMTAAGSPLLPVRGVSGLE